MNDVTEDQLLRRTVMRFAMSRFERLAGDIVAQVQKSPSCAMFEDGENADTLWDNYCYDQNRGAAPLLESAWSDIFAPYLSEAIKALDPAEAALLTFYCCWDLSDDPIEIVGDPPIGTYPDALATAIMDEVTRMALDHQWRVEEGAEDEDVDWSDDEDWSDY